MSKNTKTVIILLVIAVLIAAIPLFALKDAEFGGSDDAGSVMIEEIEGEYTPWFTPILETALGGELPGEVESLIFCIQTGIGVGSSRFSWGVLPSAGSGRKLPAWRTRTTGKESNDRN